MKNEELQFYINNRDVIKNLALNTGTTQNPEFTAMCTTSEIGLSPDFEQKDWYVACDAIKRAVLTGVSLTLNTTVKLDMNNKAIKSTLKSIHTLISTGEIAQFNNQLIQFELIDDVNEGVLTYKKYQVQVVLKFSDLGGNVEDEGDYKLEIIFIGKGKEITE